MAEVRAKAWTVPPIFRLIEARGVASDEMWRTFNMGIGMVLVVRPDDAGKLLHVLSDSGAVELGRVITQAGPERFRLV
jgi:phosphoribosylformylglycinamidine cyclo-ligase